MNFILELFTYIGICLLVCTVFLSPFALIGYWLGLRIDRLVGEEAFNLKTHYAVQIALFLSVILTAATLYSWLYEHDMQLSGAMFVGLPSLIALSLIVTRQFRRHYLIVFLAITFFLLSTFFLLGEGGACIVMAAPIFYGTGLGIVFVTRLAFKKANGYTGAILYSLFLVVTTLEGVVPGFHTDRTHAVTTSAVIELPIAAVRNNLARTPEFSALPTQWLKLAGMPVPVAAHGEGLAAGALREFVFQRQDGVEERVAFRVQQANSASAVLIPVYDDTVISRWLKWQKTEFNWTELDSESTRMSVTMTFERKVDPAWYFGAMQTLVVKQAMRVLIEHGRQPAANVPESSGVNLANI